MQKLRMNYDRLVPYRCYAIIKSVSANGLTHVCSLFGRILNLLVILRVGVCVTD